MKRLPRLFASARSGPIFSQFPDHQLAHRIVEIGRIKRSTRGLLPAETAVDAEKQRDLSRVAREFLRKIKGDPPFRFDIVSVYFENGIEPEIELFRNAFSIW